MRLHLLIQRTRYSGSRPADHVEDHTAGLDLANPAVVRHPESPVRRTEGRARRAVLLGVGWQRELPRCRAEPVRWTG